MGKFNLNLKWCVEVKDKSGKLLFKKSGLSKSLLRNFMYLLQGKFQLSAITDTSSWTAPDTSNIARTMCYATASKEGTFGSFGGLVNNSLFGLRIGRGNEGVTALDYEMNILIPHGTAPNNMVYGSQSVEAVGVVGKVTSFRVTRPFTNNSGATITVKEIGSVLLILDTAPVVRYICYLRDVLPSSVAVPDGSTFTLRYTFSVTA